MFCQTDDPREGRAAHTLPNLQRIFQTRALNLIAQIQWPAKGHRTAPCRCRPPGVFVHPPGSLKRPRVSGCVRGRHCYHLLYAQTA